jgi:hypothetical protein
MPARRLLFSLTIAKKTIRSTSSSNTESESESSESESLDCSIKVCPAGGCFSKFRMLALTAATTNSISTTWRTEVSNASLVQWFKVIKVSIPSDVLTTFDTAVRPSFDALRKLPFYPDEHGVYVDTLKTPSGKHIYSGGAPHQIAKARAAFHDTPSALVQNPQSTYYGIKHSTTTPCQSQFVTLVRIPIASSLPSMTGSVYLCL